MKMKIEELRDRSANKFDETKDEKYELINKILSDDECFFIIDMDVALDILISLDVDDPVECYKQFISIEEMEKNKIRIID